jgi:putative membrane protein insertion efficiency factor
VSVPVTDHAADHADHLADPVPGSQDRRKSVAARGILVVIHFYQWVRAGRPSPCRYWPSCSNYAAEAVERHGALHGSWLAARRLGRCHPWGGSGVDPVPD